MVGGRGAELDLEFIFDGRGAEVVEEAVGELGEGCI
jgi:hypothetical protein